MAESIENPHPFGIDALMNAAASGLLIFEISKGENQNEQQYRCISSNGQADALTGQPALSGMDWRAIAGAQAGSLRESPATQISELYFEKSGKWCQAINKPLNDRFFLCTLTDISDRKEFELKNQQLDGILDGAERTLTFGSWMGHIGRDSESSDWWSEGLYNLLGYSSEEASSLVPSSAFYFQHVHAEDRELLKGAVEQSFTNKTAFETEYRITTKNGEEKFVISRGLFRDADQSGPAYSYGNAFDLTPIRKISSELEQKVKELNRSNFDLEQFAYVASHDLQEPLRKIVSFGERLDMKSRETLNEESKLYLNRILSASRRMQDMVVNLLEFSRIARSRDGFTSTDLGAVMQGVLGDLELAIQAKSAEIQIDPLPAIEVIPIQIAQLFQNLLTNALKFTRDGVIPSITIKANKLDSIEQLNYGLPANRSYLRLLFADNGIGFSNEDSSRIFTLFQRLRGRSEYEGAGIGLSVCKKVVENHSGIIMAYAKPDHGALFTIILPFENA